MFSFEVHPPLPTAPPANGPPRRRGDFSVTTLLPRYLHTRKWVFAFASYTQSRPRLGLVARPRVATHPGVRAYGASATGPVS
jgi:hypothetical protein